MWINAGRAASRKTVASPVRGVGCMIDLKIVLMVMLIGMLLLSVYITALPH